ncbi:MAG TPA: sulfite exporter TauE/SafE family protein [Vicinamibacterales bacterium]|nr:sulfite exporter TauE/SafE family protein [Vicinamibacterales bacterium]
MPGTTWAVLAVLVFATFIRSAFGFGEALVAVPLLALIMPVDVAAPVAVLVSITVAAVIVVQDWRAVHFGSAAWLVVATLAGTPLGLLLLTRAPEAMVKVGLAVAIIAFSAYSLLRRPHATLADNGLAWIFGLAAGVLGGAYGMNGPPLVVFGTLRGWSPQEFRATLQAYFLPASAVVMAGYWFAGLWVPPVTRYYVMALPGIAAAILLGRVVNRRLDAHRFLMLVHGGLIMIGAILFAQALGR